MKLLILIVHQVRRFIYAHRTFYTFFILAQCIAIIISLYGAATIQSIFAKQEEIDENTLYFEVDLLLYSDTETEQKLIGYKEQNGILVPVYTEQPKADTSLTLSWDDMQTAVRAVLAESPIDNLSYVQISGRYDNYSFGVLQYQQPPVQAYDTVRLYAETFPNQSAGNTIELGGYCYTVSKVTNNLTRDIFFPENAVPDDVECRNVRFYYQHPPTTSEAEEMKTLLARHFHYNSLLLPQPVDPLTAQFNATVLLCSGLMIIAVLINICYAQQLRFGLERYSLAVYRLCGCSSNTIFGICMSECILVTLVLYQFCAILFHTLLRPLIIPWYAAAETLYTLRFYVLFGIAYVLLQIILLSFPLLYFIRQDIVQAEKGATL